MYFFKIKEKIRSFSILLSFSTFVPINEEHIGGYLRFFHMERHDFVLPPNLFCRVSVRSNGM